MKRLILLGFISIIIFTIQLYAQDIENYMPKSFEISKYKGKIGNYPITVILTIHPNDSITGYYYYDNIGKFIRLISESNYKNGIKLKAFRFEQFGENETKDEIFFLNEKSLINNTELNGQWVYDNKKLPVTLKIDNTIGEWRILNYKSIKYYKNSYYHTQETERQIVFPSLKYSPSINKVFLFISQFSRPLIDFINSTESSYLQISENFGEYISDENEDGCWSSSMNTELVYITDSIVTYKTNGFSYCTNGYSHEEYKSYMISSGEQIQIRNVFNINSIDSVLTMLKNKYKLILQEHNPNIVSTSDAPYFSDYHDKTEIFVSKGGIYFRARLYKLANYYDLYLSYNEIDKYLDESFKKTINCTQHEDWSNQTRLGCCSTIPLPGGNRVSQHQSRAR